MGILWSEARQGALNSFPLAAAHTSRAGEGGYAWYHNHSTTQVSLLCLEQYSVTIQVYEMSFVELVMHSSFHYRLQIQLQTNLVFLSLQTSEGVPEKVFRTLKDLIYNYEKPNQGLVTKLRYPVKKTSSSRRSQKLKLGNDDVYDGEKSSLVCHFIKTTIALTGE